MVDLIKSPGDPIWRQYVPTVQELEVQDGIVDSLAEDANSPVPNITHRYPDRALFLVSPVCAAYCRFCTRRRKVGDPEKIPMSQLESAFRYLEEHHEIRDVIMSGGGALLLSDRRIDEICKRLRAIPHLEVLRIGSRVPCHLPERVTPELCAILKKYHPLYINTHFNHPDELTPAAVKALGMLADAGIPLGCQTVLLRGVNDDPEVMKLLMQRLLTARVRPYYIYMCDQVAGAEHFRTTVEKGLEIVKALRGWTSGLAVPHFVIDAPGGGGKIPLLPEYVVKLTDKEVVLRNYAGKIYRYKQGKTSAQPLEPILVGGRHEIHPVTRSGLLPLALIAGCAIHGRTPTDNARPLVATLMEQESHTTALLQAVSAVDDSVIWASGHRATWARTVDGGRTWVPGEITGPDSPLP